MDWCSCSQGLFRGPDQKWVLVDLKEEDLKRVGEEFNSPDLIWFAADVSKAEEVTYVQYIPLTTSARYAENEEIGDLILVPCLRRKQIYYRHHSGDRWGYDHSLNLIGKSQPFDDLGKEKASQSETTYYSNVLKR